MAHSLIASRRLSTSKNGNARALETNKHTQAHTGTLRHRHAHAHVVENVYSVESAKIGGAMRAKVEN